MIIVMLRRPKAHADESRTDPYWEFGSFGTTGCYWRSAMNPKRIDELNGKRFAFAQGGSEGFRLVHVTPALSVRLHLKSETAEALWQPADMPLRYAASPCLIDNSGYTDFPSLLAQIRGVRRPTWVSQFASVFRTRRRPLAGEVGAELLDVYQRWRSSHKTAVARSYVDALPYPPPLIETPEARRRSYRKNVRRC